MRARLEQRYEKSLSSFTQWSIIEAILIKETKHILKAQSAKSWANYEYQLERKELTIEICLKCNNSLFYSFNLNDIKYFFVRIRN